MTSEEGSVPKQVGGCATTSSNLYRICNRFYKLVQKMRHFETNDNPRNAGSTICSSHTSIDQIDPTSDEARPKEQVYIHRVV